MRDEGSNGVLKIIGHYTDGAGGAGLALVAIPFVTLYSGIGRMSDVRTVGLPMSAVFGIMMLFGAPALISTLFARLRLPAAEN